MAQQMTESQRLQALEAYNPTQHLIKIKGRDGIKDYYPAAYRFYELNLRYPNANFSTDLIYYDIEKNFCVVKCRLYLGADYETSEKKAESMKQGLFTALDKVETAAKARCLRDFGIGTEYALEFSDEDEDIENAARLTQSTPPAPRPQNTPRSLSAAQQTPPLTWSAVYRAGAHKGMWSRENFYATASALLDGVPVSAETVKSLSQEQLQKLSRDIEQYQPEQKAS